MSASVKAAELHLLGKPLVVSFSVWYENNLIQNMQRLEEDMQRVVLKKAVFAAGKPIAEALSGGAPVQDPVERSKRQRQDYLRGVTPSQVLSDSVAFSWGGWTARKFITIGPFTHHGLFQELHGPHKGWARRAWVGVQAEARTTFISALNAEIKMVIDAGGARAPTPWFERYSWHN